MGITGYDDTTGHHGLGERNENKKRFSNLCPFNKIIIDSTTIPSPQTHTECYTGFTGRHYDEPVTIYAPIKFRRTMEDVRAKRDASDHHFVVTKMKLKPKKH